MTYVWQPLHAFGAVAVVLPLLSAACRSETTPATTNRDSSGSGTVAAAVQRTSPATRIIAAPTRTIQIPVRFSRAGEDPRAVAVDGTLTLRQAQEEQPAEGPQSFAVMDNGELVIADPLRERLAVYSADGTYQRSVNAQVPVESVVAIREGVLGITESGRSAVTAIDFDGRRLAAAAVTATPQPSATLTSERSGRIRLPAAAVQAATAPPAIAVELAEPSLRLASLQVIATTASHVYVVMESAEASGRSLSSLTQLVRRYTTSDSTPDREIRNISNDYYVVPRTPFRVANDVLYQLFPTAEGVQIRQWDLE